MQRSSPPSVLLHVWLLALATGSARADDQKVLDGGQFRSEVRTAQGRIASFSFEDRSLTIDTADGPLVLSVDRDTAIFREDRYGSPRDLKPGARVRAAYGDGHLAYWVEVGEGNESTDGGAGGGPPHLKEGDPGVPRDRDATGS
ncbi:MAG TPA: hypothetical protein VLV17_04790 [Anaeromyxobacteraceae bacterium]|nr:hypothetical protein [Anaeromyxobacteraceae bacterium]